MFTGRLTSFTLHQRVAPQTEWPLRNMESHVNFNESIVRNR